MRDHVVSDMLYMLMRYASPSSLFEVPDADLSGPVKLLYLLCFIASCALWCYFWIVFVLVG